MAHNRPSSSQSRMAWGDEGLNVGYNQAYIRDDPDLPNEVYMDNGGRGNLASVRAKNQSKNGCMSTFLRGLRSLWATRHTEETKSNRELYVKTTLRELVIYIVFLTIICVITFGMTSTTMYYYTKVMSDLFVDTPSTYLGTFRGITNTDAFWKFAKEPLLKGLYWEKYYNKEDVEEKGYIYYENKLLGRPRIRLLRVYNNSCTVHDDFGDIINSCFDTYSPGIEDKTPFTDYDANSRMANYTAWKYKSEEELGGSTHWGLLTTYSGGGYVQDLADNLAESEQIINDLFDKRWITRGTRAVFIDFTVYNANINLFCVVRLLVEFPPMGGAIPSWTFQTVKLIRYVSVGDYFIMACECIFCLFIIYYIMEEILEIRKHKMAYFKGFWNILDILVILISIICVAFDVYRTIAVGEKLASLLENENVYADFERLSYWETRFSNAIAMAVFMAWIKIFKYISFNKTMTQLSSTLGRCAKDLAGFAVMFFIIFLAFTQLGYLLFGTQVKDFSSFQNSFFTLFRIILGDFDFHQLEAANRILGPIFFMLFVFFVFFVLINMFLAIINDTYSEVKGDMANKKNEFELTDFFKRSAQKMMDKLSLKRDKIVDIQQALKSADMNQDMNVDFDEWRTDLKSRGYADGEIEAMFAKYDIDGDRVLDSVEQRRMQEDLKNQKDAINEEYKELERDLRQHSNADRRVPSRGSGSYDDSGEDSDDDEGGAKAARPGRTSNDVSYEEFTVLARRVDRMEHSIGSIVSKIDAVLVKLEAMEKAKLKRRETMGKILDSITESDATTDEMKREQMERLVREELERWDTESMTGSGRGSSPGGNSPAIGMRSRPGMGQNFDEDEIATSTV